MAAVTWQTLRHPRGPSSALLSVGPAGLGSVSARPLASPTPAPGGLFRLHPFLHHARLPWGWPFGLCGATYKTWRAGGRGFLKLQRQASRTGGRGRTLQVKSSDPWAARGTLEVTRPPPKNQEQEAARPLDSAGPKT